MSLAPIKHDDTNPDSEFSGGLVPAGEYVATILPTNKDGSTIVVRPYAQSGDNANLQALAVRFRIDDDQPYKGRNLFVDVAWARTFASGKRNGNYFALIRDVAGFDTEVDNFTLTDEQVRSIVSKKAKIVVEVQPGQSGYPDRNRIAFINKHDGTPAKGPDAVQPRTTGGSVAQQGWAPNATPQASTPQPAAWQPPQTEQESPWNPPQADPQLQAAAAAGGGF